MLRLIGELDLATADEIESACRAVALTDFARVVLDMRELEFIDSTGLRTILALHRSLDGTCRFEIVPGPPQVHRIFRITGTEDELPFTTPVRRYGESQP